MHFDIKNPRNIAALTPRQLNKFEIGTAMLNSWTESDPWKPSAKQVGWLMLRMLAHNADAISFSINLDGSKAGVGLNATPRGVIAVLTGPDKGKRVGYGDASLSFGENLGVAAVVTEYYYLGPSSALKISDFPGGQLSSSFAVSPFGFIEIGNGYEISQADDGGYIIGRTREIGIAPNPAPGVSFDFNIGKSWLYNVIVD
jgi:hypothetical protein